MDDTDFRKAVRLCVIELYERDEYRPCGYANDDGDCANWDYCQSMDLCPLARLAKLVGIVPQTDGGVDKQ